MKKTAAIISACMLTFALSACSGSNYVMHTNDGRTIVSDGKPQTDNDTGMISQLGGATLITMDRQGKCTGSEKR